MKNLLIICLLAFSFSALAHEPIKADFNPVETPLNSHLKTNTMHKFSENFDFDNLLSTIQKLDFPESEYFKEITPKTQICLHHTASGKGVSGDHAQFLKPGRIATPLIVGHSNLYQLFSSRYWGYHLGLSTKHFAAENLEYKNLNKSSIGLEIDSWGPLKLINGEFRAWPNKFGTGDTIDKRTGKPLKVVVDSSEVVEYSKPYRGYNYYQAYNTFQIDTTAWLLEYWHSRYAIPLHYNDDMWDVSTNALTGTPGVYTHASYRPDKSDCHPQPELINMLKSLTC